MQRNTTIKIPKVRFREPERNLPGRGTRTTTAETRFTIQFARAYLGQLSAIHHGTEKHEMACARQVAVNGFGITDLLTVAWKTRNKSNVPATCPDFLQDLKPTVRAFEVKLDNWRKGMIQAHRYRYFSNVAILVMPWDRCIRALPFLDTFRRIRVGLWGFDLQSNRIHSHFTPRPHRPIEPKYQLRAVELVGRTTRALPFL